MKNIKALIIAIVMVTTLGCTTIPITSAPYSEDKDINFTNLVWSDEFDGDTLNQENWNYNLGTGASVGLVGWGNNELEYYTDRTKNVEVKDGELIITALKESYKGSNYTSGKITTKGKVDILYGRVEARIKLPVGRGIWPAFWMMPTYEEYGTWAASGEIDIVEMVGHEPHLIHGTIHWGGNWPDNKHSGKRFQYKDKKSIASEYHLYAVEWTEEGISWFIDDEMYSHIPADEWLTYTDEEDVNAPFDKRFYIMLNMAVGGNWPGKPNETTIFPNQMFIDYVRVYR